MSKLTLGKCKSLVRLDCAPNKSLKKLDIGKCPALVRVIKKKNKKTDKQARIVSWSDGKAAVIIPLKCRLTNGSRVLYKG